MRIAVLIGICTLCYSSTQAAGLPRINERHQIGRRGNNILGTIYDVGNALDMNAATCKVTVENQDPVNKLKVYYQNADGITFTSAILNPGESHSEKCASDNKCKVQMGGIDSNSFNYCDDSTSGGGTWKIDCDDYIKVSEANPDTDICTVYASNNVLYGISTESSSGGGSNDNPNRGMSCPDCW